MYWELGAVKRITLNYFPRFLFNLKWHKRKTYQVKKLKKFQFFKFLFWSPELDTYSYNLTNKKTIEEKLAIFFEYNLTQLKKYRKDFDRIKLDRSTLFKRLFLVSRLKVFPKFGRHYINYMIIRIYEPNLIIETGTKDGLGSFVMAKGLEMRNKSVEIQMPKPVLITSEVNSEKPVYFNSKTSNIIFYNEDSLQTIGRLVESGLRVKKCLLISDCIPGDEITLEFDLIAKIAIESLVFVHHKNWSDYLFRQSVYTEYKITEIEEETDHPIYTGKTDVIGLFKAT